MTAGRRVSLWAGLLTLALALSPPMDELAERKLSAHMVQHLALWLIASPLLAWGRPLLTARLAMPLRARRAMQGVALAARPLARGAIHPLAVGAVVAASLWAWHLPRLYEAALGSGLVHALEHATFIGGSVLFWNTVLRRRLGRGAAILLIFATMLQTAWLAMVISFATDVVYAVYGDAADALADQQLAGVLMWVPMTTVYAAVIGVLFVRWLNELDLRIRWRESREPVRAER